MKTINSEYPKILSSVKAIENIESLINIELESIGKNIPLDCPSDFRRFIQYFPSFYLFTSSSWKAALVDKNVKLEGYIFGMNMLPNGSITVNHAEYVITEKNIVNWVKLKVSSNSINYSNEKNDTNLIYTSNTLNTIRENTGDIKVVRGPIRRWN